MKKHVYTKLSYLLIMGFLSGLLGCKSSKQSASTPAVDQGVQVESLSGGIKIAWQESGQGSDYLLLIHGLGSNMDVWEKMIPQLEKQFRVIRIDLPGYGHAGAGDYAYTLAFFAESLEALLEKKNITHVNLLGHSMGGQIALHMALRGKVSIDRLILLAPAGFETFSAAESRMMLAATTPEALLALPDEQIHKNFAINFNGNQLPEDAQFMYEARLKLKADMDAYQAYCRMIPACVKAMLNEPVFNRLGEIDQPTLVLYGEHDLLIPNRYLHPTLTVKKVAEAGAKQLRNSQLHLLPACGHMVPWDQPGLVVDHIQTFFNP